MFQVLYDLLHNSVADNNVGLVAKDGTYGFFALTGRDFQKRSKQENDGLALAGLPLGMLASRKRLFYKLSCPHAPLTLLPPRTRRHERQQRNTIAAPCPFMCIFKRAVL